MKFETPCYHPNVDQSGNICLDILKEKWSALYDVRTILLSLQSLLGGEFVQTIRSFKQLEVNLLGTKVLLVAYAVQAQFS